METTQRSDEEEAVPAAVEPAKARPSRRWPLVLSAILIAIVLLGVVLVRQGLSIRRDLELGRAAMEHGRDQLLAGDAATAAASFDDGRRAFSAANDTARQPLLRVIGWFPLVGRTPDAVAAIASSGEATAAAGSVLARALADVPGGVAGLAPTGGSIPLDRIGPLADAATRADALMSAALTTLEDAPDSLLLGPVGPARVDAETQVRDLRDTVHAASLLLRGLPTFLGADGPKHYFFGAQTPAEERGSGGLIGAYSILTIDEGRFRFSPFRTIYRLPATPLRDLPSPNPDYAANYYQFRTPLRFWSSINVMPDFPSVAKAILGAYQAATGTPLDGVMVADPFALSALLEATGPVEVPRLGVRIDADNVVDFTTNQAYSLFHNSNARKRVLGDAAKAAFEGFLAEPSKTVGDLKRLLETAAERHILAYSEDPVMQEGLRATPVGGTLRPPGAQGDLLFVSVTSGAGSKVDFYQQRTIHHTVQLEADGSASETTDLVLENHAPTSGEPPYVIGPFHPRGHVGPILQTLRPGESVALVNVYCGPDCVPGAATLDGTPFTPATRVDLGERYLQHYYEIQSGQRRALHLTWDVPNGWVGNSSGGVYRMTFGNQVTIRPTELSIRIEPPEGMSIVSASAPLRIVDGAAVYRGVPGSRLDLQVTFRPPLPVRLWRNITRFFSTPVVRL